MIILIKNYIFIILFINSFFRSIVNTLCSVGCVLFLYETKIALNEVKKNNKSQYI